MAILCRKYSSLLDTRNLIEKESPLNFIYSRKGKEKNIDKTHKKQKKKKRIVATRSDSGVGYAKGRY